MAGAAVLGRLTWRLADVVDLHDETPDARTLGLRVRGWPGHVAGQHVDVRLTAPDGYTAVRSYSVASASDGDRVELTVERLPDGEVSPYLTTELAVGDRIEVLGPLGGWFVWRPEQTQPLQLVAGGSGLVPLMAMLRVRAAAESPAPARLLCSVRSPDLLLYADELAKLAADGSGLDVTYAWTRTTPPGWPDPPHRVDADLLGAATWPPDAGALTYVCGPTPFVEAVAELLLAAGHAPGSIRTERFGGSGGSP